MKMMLRKWSGMGETPEQSRSVRVSWVAGGEGYRMQDGLGDQG